jgi:biopolymer transport protein ExbD
MAVKINRGRSNVIDMTPMIDCVFQLIIFFLVATEFAEQEKEMSVKLPEASEAQALMAKPKELFVNVTDSGRYFVSSKVVSMAELQQILNQTYVNNPGRATVIIRADERCAWKNVIAVMNACNKAKIRDYRVTARDGPDG